jgi:hypothetical protein
VGGWYGPLLAPRAARDELAATRPERSPHPATCVSGHPASALGTVIDDVVAGGHTLPMANEAHDDGNPGNDTRNGGVEAPAGAYSPAGRGVPSSRRSTAGDQVGRAPGSPAGPFPEAPGGSVKRGGDDVAWWSPGLRLVRWLLGATTLVGGSTWILLNLHGPSAVLDTVVGCVLAAGGLVLLMPHRIQLPPVATTVAVCVVGLAGTAAGLVARTAQTCCDVAYIVDRGWPFRWVQRGAVADDVGTAYRLAQSAEWRVDVVALAANVLLWAYAGMLVVVVAVLVRRARRKHEAPRQ